LLDRAIAKIDALEVAQMKRTYTDVLDWFGPFANAGLSLLGLSLIALLGVRYTSW